jgi:thymidylate synthase (FAD)
MNEITNKISVLDHGHVQLLNLAGPSRRIWSKEIPDNWLLPFDEMDVFDADDIDPAQVARISFDNFDRERTREADLKLYEYLVANWHNTPVEMIETWWHMQMPIFVARQVVRHRTAAINEVSGRYAVLPDIWYIPEAKNVGIKGGSNKQGRLLVWDELEAEQKSMIESFRRHLATSCKDSYEEYLFYLGNGIAPELARCFLHVNHYTHWVYKMDLHNLMHFMSLRCDGHAQWEAQQYGNAVYNILKQHLPKSMELFDTYRRKATPEELTHLGDALALIEHYQNGMDAPAESMETVRKFFKRLGVK